MGQGKAFETIVLKYIEHMKSSNILFTSNNYRWTILAFIFILQSKEFGNSLNSSPKCYVFLWLPYGTWPKELFTNATDLRRIMEPYMFCNVQYLALLTLVLHDMLSVATKLAKRWRKLAHIIGTLLWWYLSLSSILLYTSYPYL